MATGANAAFRALGFVLLSQIPSTWMADGDGLLMSAMLADTTNRWRVPISPKTWKVLSAPWRLKFGTTMEVQPAVAGGNQVVFSSLNENVNIWSLPTDANGAKPAGNLQRLIQDILAQGKPAVSPDGRKLAFSSRRSGNRDIWTSEKQPLLPRLFNFALRRACRSADTF